MPKAETDACRCYGPGPAGTQGLRDALKSPPRAAPVITSAHFRCYDPHPPLRFSRKAARPSLPSALTAAVCDQLGSVLAQPVVNLLAVDVIDQRLGGLHRARSRREGELGNFLQPVIEIVRAVDDMLDQTDIVGGTPRQSLHRWGANRGARPARPDGAHDEG